MIKNLLALMIFIFGASGFTQTLDWNVGFISANKEPSLIMRLAKTTEDSFSIIFCQEKSVLPSECQSTSVARSVSKKELLKLASIDLTDDRNRIVLRKKHIQKYLDSIEVQKEKLQSTDLDFEKKITELKERIKNATSEGQKAALTSLLKSTEQDQITVTNEIKVLITKFEAEVLESQKALVEAEKELASLQLQVEEMQNMLSLQTLELFVSVKVNLRTDEYKFWQNIFKKAILEQSLKDPAVDLVKSTLSGQPDYFKSKAIPGISERQIVRVSVNNSAIQTSGCWELHFFNFHLNNMGGRIQNVTELHAEHTRERVVRLFLVESPYIPAKGIQFVNDARKIYEGCSGYGQIWRPELLMTYGY